MATKSPKQLEDLFHETLKDMYYAEKKILTALPKMAKAAHSEELRAAFEKHEGETEEQVQPSGAGLRGDRAAGER
jgi:ferritin-like metal-binding protein YciE